MKTKICKSIHGCRLEKPIIDFAPNGKYYKSMCKICYSKYSKIYNKKNKEKRHKYYKDWSKNNKERNQDRNQLNLAGTKYCPKCLKHITKNEFPKNSCTKDGLDTYCKKCKILERKTIKKDINRIKKEASYRNIFYNLSDEEQRQIRIIPCYYCGGFDKEDPFTNIKYNGIDRINSTKGYVIENCRSSCSKCNYMKSSLSEEEFAIHILNLSKQKWIQKYYYSLTENESILNKQIGG